jgi:serine/threonine-protein kinase
MADDGLSPGDLLAGRYRLIDRVGAGGMAVIWRAHDETLERLVAVKVLDLSLSGDARMRDLVRREAWAAARLNHPDVASVHDFVQVGDFGVLVMQLVEGSPVADLIAAGPLPWQEAVRIGMRVALVLDHAHHRGVIHRDITPDNIVVHGDRVTVLDFGIAAKIGEPDDDSTGASFGTPAYVAPERLDGTPAQTATDVYALGVVLFEMLTARIPFRVRGWDDVAGDHGPVPLLRVSGLPSSVRSLVAQMLSRDAAARPRAEQVAEVLREALSARRSHVLLASALTAAMVGAALVIWWPRPPSQPTYPPAAPRTTVQATATASASASPQAEPTQAQPSQAEPTLAEPTQVVPTPLPLTREQALFMVLSAISDGVAEGSIRPDAGLDLQQLLRQADSEEEVEKVRAKIAVREEEGAISSVTARALETALANLAAAF